MGAGNGQKGKPGGQTLPDAAVIHMSDNARDHASGAVSTPNVHFEYDGSNGSSALQGVVGEADYFVFNMSGSSLEDNYFGEADYIGNFEPGLDKIIIANYDGDVSLSYESIYDGIIVDGGHVITDVRIHLENYNDDYSLNDHYIISVSPVEPITHGSIYPGLIAGDIVFYKQPLAQDMFL